MLLLRPFGFDTLSVWTYNLASESRFEQAALPALAIIVVAIVPVAMLSRQLSRGRGQGMTPWPPPLHVDGLMKRFGEVQALAGVGFALGDDELLALVGPSGCGKSTLLRTIAGLVDADAGTVRLGGELVDDGDSHRTARAAPHRSRLPGARAVPAPDRRAERRLRCSSGHPPRRRRHGSRRCSTLVEPRRLRRAAIPTSSRAASVNGWPSPGRSHPDPTLMLFDEPFASLDHNLRISFRHDVVRALKATATPAVFVTHDQHEALAIGDRIAVMRRGASCSSHTLATVFHRPVDRFVAVLHGRGELPRDRHPSPAVRPRRSDRSTPHPASISPRAGDGASRRRRVRPSRCPGAEEGGLGSPSSWPASTGGADGSSPRSSPMEPPSSSRVRISAHGSGHAVRLELAPGTSAGRGPERRRGRSRSRRRRCRTGRPERGLLAAAPAATMSSSSRRRRWSAGWRAASRWRRPTGRLRFAPAARIDGAPLHEPAPPPAG